MSRLKRLARVSILAACIALAAPSAALADDLVNKLDNNADAELEQISLSTGGTSQQRIKVAPADNDGNGCNLNSQGEAVSFNVSSSNTAVATVDRSSLTFTNCNEQEIVVTAVAGGSATIRFSQASNSSDGTFRLFADFTVNVMSTTAPPPPPNSAPSVDSISGLTTVNEGVTGGYSVSASDPDGDTLSYAWSITGGNASIVGSSTGSTVSVDFTDGPSTVGLKVDVRDGNGHTVTRTLSITELNVAPTVNLSGSSSANEGDTKTYTYTVTDPGADTHTVTEECSGIAIYGGTATANSFSCSFPDNGTYAVRVSADDGDASNNLGSDSISVNVANVAPTITNFVATPTNAIACLGGNTVNVSVEVSDPATDVFDAITGTLNGAPFTGRSVSESLGFGPGPWTVAATVNDGDGGSASRSTGGSFLYSTTGGFPLPPFNTDGSSNFKLGSTIPVKLRIVDCQGRPVSGLAPQVGLARTGTTADGAVNEPVDTVSVPDDGRTMRYDAAAGQYIYNLSTKRSVFASGGPLSLGRYTLTVGGSLIAATPSVSFDILK